MEIELDCLHGEHSSLHVVIARETPDLLLDLQFLGNTGDAISLGSAFRIEIIKIWPRVEQLDKMACLHPFFPRALGDDFWGLWPS
jgi:hypothetical protein